MAEREKKIRVVVPVVGFDAAGDGVYGRLGSPGTSISVSQVERGPSSIETAFDSVLAAPDTIRLVVEAEREGMDAVVIDCMDDPGLEAGRELVSIPVLGPCQAAMHLAAMLGRRFSVITDPDENAAGLFEDHARAYGVSGQLASVRWVDIPVLELDRDRERLVREVVRESAASVEHDRAGVIILGCTGMLGLAEAVRSGLDDMGITGVPIIDPLPVAVRLAEALVDLHLSHSKRSYPTAAGKSVVGFEAFAEDPVR
jgi:allantoin racemase